MASPSLAALSGPDAHAVLARLRRPAPVSWIPALAAWLVTSHEMALRVVRDAATFTVDDPRFSTAQVVGASMLSLDGAEHRRHRAAFGPAFRPREVDERFAAVVGAAAARLVDAVRAGGRAELRTALAGPLSVAVVADALGLTDIDADTVLGWYAEIVAAVTALSGGDRPDPAASAAMNALDGHVRGALATAPALRDATAALSAGEIVANAAVMMFGGIETTEGMIASAIGHVLGRDGFVEQLADDALLDAAVEESLRLEPAAAAVDRYATRDVSLGTAHIAAGDLVRVSIAAANRDPAVYDDPDVFDPTRRNVRQHLAFAQGPHVCIAADLARLETRAALRAVLDLPGVRLDAPVVTTGLIFRKPAAVWVRWEV